MRCCKEYHVSSICIWANFHWSFTIDKLVQTAYLRKPPKICHFYHSLKKIRAPKYRTPLPHRWRKCSFKVWWIETCTEHPLSIMCKISPFKLTQIGRAICFIWIFTGFVILKSKITSMKVNNPNEQARETKFTNLLCLCSTCERLADRGVYVDHINLWNKLLLTWKPEGTSKSLSRLMYLSWLTCAFNFTRSSLITFYTCWLAAHVMWNLLSIDRQEARDTGFKEWCDVSVTFV